MDAGDSVTTILERFRELSAVPRGSGREAAAREWVESWARVRRFGYRADGAGNLVVRVPASAGSEHRPAVILQGHLDMVCEKTAASAHDFRRDPIVPVRDGDWLRARGTTLGADNGIAVALALAVAEDPSLRRPPLELLFTVEEESGLGGARNLDAGLLDGRMLLNLDSEAEGVVTVGCAGGADTLVELALERQPLPAGGCLYRAVLSGAAGGHSGVDIHLGRANAILLLACALAAASGEGARLASFDGGTVRNAIPRDAAAALWLPHGGAPRFLEAFGAEAERLRAQHAATDPGLRLDLEPAEDSAGGEEARSAFSAVDSQRLLRLLGALPDGVAGICPDFPGIVETSNNIGVIRTTAGGVEIASSERGSSIARMRDLSRRIRCVAALAGASARGDVNYPPWQPDLGSPLLERARRVWRSRHGKDPEVRIIHAGLECAVIGDRVPGMDMISLGPTIEGAHSPDERLSIPSLAPVWELVTGILASLAS